MDDFSDLSHSNSSSSTVYFRNHHPINTVIPTCNQKLQQLLQTQTHHPWAYAIFWKTLSQEDGQQLALTWADAYFLQNPTNQPLRKSMARTFTTGKGSALLKAYVSGSIMWLAGADNLLSINFEIAKEAHIQGVETLVFVPTSNGVVEMGSYHPLHDHQMEMEYSDLVHEARSLFGAGSSSFSSSSAAATLLNKTDGGRGVKPLGDINIAGDVLEEDDQSMNFYS